MSTIAMIPNNPSAETITIISKTYSMLLLSLSAYGVILENDCECGECELGGAIEILPEEVANDSPAWPEPPYPGRQENKQ